MSLTDEVNTGTDVEAARWRRIAPHLPGDMTGWRALEIGCNAGYHAIELAKRGAHVTGFDADPQALIQARRAAERLGLADRVTFQQGRAYDLASTWGTYDLVLFMGVLPRLRYPLLGLDIAVRKAGKLFLFQTPAPTDGGVEAMLCSGGLRVLSRPEAETWLCEPDPAFPPDVRAWNAAELRAAAGLDPRLTRTLHFRNCWVNTAPGYTETCFHDGTRVTATPEDSEEYRANAAHFGYGHDTESLSREHEILHTFLAEALGCGASPTLWAVAHGQGSGVAPAWEQEEEEAWTLAFQSYLNGGPETEPLRRLTDAGLSLAGLRDRARDLLR